MKAVLHLMGGELSVPSTPSQALPLAGRWAAASPSVQGAPGPAGAEGGRLTWSAAEGGDDGQNAHDAQVGDPGGVVLREQRGACEEAG